MNKDELRAKLLEAQIPYIERNKNRLERIKPLWNSIQKPLTDIVESADDIDMVLGEYASTVDPYIQIIDGNSNLLDLLFYGRMTISSFPFSGAVGRRVYYLIRNKSDGVILGLVVLMSDLTIPIRDRDIGWSREQMWKRMKYTMNVHLAIPTPQLSQYLTGKLTALSVESKEIQDYYQQKYGHPLAMMTCTSLFGESSVYNRLKGYNYLGTTKGHSVALVPLDIKIKMREDFKAAKGKYSETYYNEDGSVRERYGVVKGFQKLGKYWDVKQAENQRGVYVIPLSHNYKEFLRGEADVIQPFDHSTFSTLAQYWQERWLSGRIGRINSGEVKGYSKNHTTTNT